MRISKIIKSKWINASIILKRLAKVYLRIVYSCDIPIGLKIGNNVYFAHNALGVVIHRGVIIKDNVKIFQNVTIGTNLGEDDEMLAPVIGNNVIICAGAKIIGHIEIGDNVIIGAGAVVLKNVDSDVIVAGNPAKVIKKR
ncbi:serine acetyltransferase [Clostridiaceae bacterium DONG20-135]|uniref:Serine acetyltransferase n=1 Tax=Copranaerobaculum intestinale TaxID=2692629 RepID=A0A6N8U629_9FIRM|nr:serine acetyltransferase [Copranaerobaculum intestinale]MXQ72774.1 serine acetyltransferase [Copranaerobaculum intestinale]